MPYRQAAEMPKKEAKPLERFVVSRYGIYPAIAIVVGTAVLVLFIAYAVLAHSHLLCTRASAGAMPRCIATQKAGLVTPVVTPFDLKESSLQIAEREWDDTTHVVVVTPGGELRGAVDRPFAEATVAGSKRFVKSPNELRWEAATRNTFTMRRRPA